MKYTYPSSNRKNMQLDVKYIYFHEINLYIAKRLVNESRRRGHVVGPLGDNRGRKDEGTPIGGAFLTKATSPN